MNSNNLILAIIAILIVSFFTTQAGNDGLYGSEKNGFDEAVLNPHIETSMHQLIGQDIVDSKGRMLGTIENFQISGPDDVQYAFISVGNFFGFEDKLIIIPVIQLQMNKATKNIMLKNVTVEQLNNSINIGKRI